MPLYNFLFGVQTHIPARPSLLPPCEKERAPHYCCVGVGVQVLHQASTDATRLVGRLKDASSLLPIWPPLTLWVVWGRTSLPLEDGKSSGFLLSFLWHYPHRGVGITHYSMTWVKVYVPPWAIADRGGGGTMTFSVILGWSMALWWGSPQTLLCTHWTQCTVVFTDDIFSKRLQSTINKRKSFIEWTLAKTRHKFLRVVPQ